MKFWKRRRSPHVPPSPKRPEEPLTRAALAWLLAALALAVAPHAQELPVWLTVLFVALVGWRGFIAFRDQALPPRWLLLIVAVLAGAGVLIDYRTLFGRDAGVALLTAMTACKLLESRATRDGVVLVFLGYLLVMSNLLYSQDIPRVAYLLAVIVAILTAQVLIHRQHAGLTALAPLWLTGRMALLAVPVMLILFVLFPAHSRPAVGAPQGCLQGPHRAVRPDDAGDDQRTEPVRRSGVPGPLRQPRSATQPALLARAGAVAFRWPALEPARGTADPNSLRRSRRKAPAVDYAVVLEPSNRSWLLALDLPARLPPSARMTPFVSTAARSAGQRGVPLRNAVVSDLSTGELTGRNAFAAFNCRRGQSARAGVGGGLHKRDPRPEALVNAALTLFREHAFYYTLTPPLLGGETVDDFLFRARQGFCEHYANAFVFLMRAAGVPARVVTGYQGGEMNVLGDYMIVRQADAHAWAEVWLAGRGWVRVDPRAR